MTRASFKQGPRSKLWSVADLHETEAERKQRQGKTEWKYQLDRKGQNEADEEFNGGSGKDEAFERPREGRYCPDQSTSLFLT